MQTSENARDPHHYKI